MNLIAILALLTVTPFTAQVVSIHDGDTITVRRADPVETVKIRLDGIDAPELKQPYGQAAKVTLSGLVFGKSVEIVPKNKDRYGRTIAQVKADGQDVNNEMVAKGAAWWYSQYAPHDLIKQQAQSDAQAQKIGLWADQNAIPPWEFRKKVAVK